jgi:polyhydroxyalkanoate synthesis regulator phasin
MKNPLDNSRPLRLLLKGGKWALELESLEQISAVVFRPIVFTVEGPDPILGALERMRADEQLILETQQLFEQYAEQSEGELNLETQGETWIQSTTEQHGFARHGAPPLSSGERAARRRRALKQNIDQLRAMSNGSARIDVLERRIAELEEQLKKLARDAAVGPKINFGGGKRPVDHLAMTQ